MILGRGCVYRAHRGLFGPKCTIVYATRFVYEALCSSIMRDVLGNDVQCNDLYRSEFEASFRECVIWRATRGAPFRALYSNVRRAFDVLRDRDTDVLRA